MDLHVYQRKKSPASQLQNLKSCPKETIKKQQTSGNLGNMGVDFRDMWLQIAGNHLGM